MPGVQSFYEIHSRSKAVKTKQNKLGSTLQATVLYRNQSKMPNYMFVDWCGRKDRDMIVRYVSPFNREEDSEFHQQFEVICVYTKDLEQN